jgi:hypothetical protein
MSSKFAHRYRKPSAAVGFGVRSSATQADASVPTITSGSGVPTATEVAGSLYLDTATGELSARVGAAWVAATAIAAIADPGDAAAIPVASSASIAITTAAAETNTLAIPTYVGQVLNLICDVYAVGDRVITAAVKINQATNTIMTFGAAGDFIQLTGVQEAGTLRWQVTANDGVALS